MLAVLFNSRVQTDLRQQAGSCGRRLSFRQAGGQFRLACFGPSLNRPNPGRLFGALFTYICGLVLAVGLLVT